MKKLKYIKNISGSNIIINGVNIADAQTVDIYGDNSTSFKTVKGLNEITRYQSSLELYSYENVLMSNDEYITFLNYFNNKHFANQNYFRIYEFLSDDAMVKYNNYSLTPKSVDYIKDVEIRFARKETFNRGFLTNVEYYESSSLDIYGNLVFENPILNVNVTYHIDSNDYVTYRETKRKWKLNNGLYSTDIKTTIKYYSGVMAREEAIQRRNNIINQLIIDVVKIVYGYYYLTYSIHDVELLIMPLLDSLKMEVDKYIKGNIQPLITGISTASVVTYTWLTIIVTGTTTLQDYIENKLLEASLSAGSYTSTEPN